MFFTFGDEAKAKKALQYGEERLAEAEAMANKDRIREMERAANDYQGYMAMVSARLEKGSVSDNVSETVCQATNRHLTALERIRERVREQAGEAIANAENASMNGQINALRALSHNRVQRAAELAADAAERNMERARLSVCDSTTSGNGASGNCTGQMEFLLNYAARLGVLEDELIAKAGELGIDVTPLLERLANSTTNRINILCEAYENAPEPARAGIENALGNSIRTHERATERLQAMNAGSANATDADTAGSRIREQVQNRLQISINNVEAEPQPAIQDTLENPNQPQNQGGNGKHGN
jgi:hypothetical protein